MAGSGASRHSQPSICGALPGGRQQRGWQRRFAPLPAIVLQLPGTAPDNMLVKQSSSIGGQAFYSTPSLIEDAADKLLNATSTTTLKAGPHKVKTGGKDLVDVVPVNTKNNTEDEDMELYADCGRSARTVSGVDNGTGSGNGATNIKYQKDGKTKYGDASQWEDIQKVSMYIDLFTKEKPFWKVWKKGPETDLNIKLIEQKMKLYKTTKRNWIAETDPGKKDVLAGTMARLSSEMDTLARAEYEKLDGNAKDQFDKDAKINAYADPEIGEMFHISTGGPAKKNGKSTWNFHWAGVVMKSGGDTVTLENYSVSDYEEENQDWAFQMYGVGKKGQSAHEEHRDDHGQLGENPTTMTATKAGRK